MAQLRDNQLPTKPKDMLTLEEMAAQLFPSAGKEQLTQEVVRLRDRVFQPLQDAYDISKAHQKSIKLESDLAVSGQWFPKSHIGYYKKDGKAVFCVDKHTAICCRRGMFGSCTAPDADMVSVEQARKLLNIADGVWQPLIESLKDAFLDRPAYARNVELQGVSIPVEQVGFFLKKDPSDASKSETQFYLKPDVLLKLHQLAHHSRAEAAHEWWKKHSILPKLKTTKWLNVEDVKEELGITALHAKLKPLETLWKQIATKFGRGGASQDGKDIEITTADGKKDTVEMAKKCCFQPEKKSCALNSAHLVYFVTRWA